MKLFGNLFGGRSEPVRAAGETVPPGVGDAPGHDAPVAAIEVPDLSTTAPAEPPTASRPPDSIVCPWCSTFIAPESVRCPSCGAALIEEPRSTEREIPGVTTVAPELVDYKDRAARAAAKKKRPSLRSLLVGEPDPMFAASSSGPVEAQVLAPPSAEVRAAMERLDHEIASGGIVDFDAGQKGDEPSPPSPPGSDTTTPPGA
jgi:hypothetical protein